MSVHIQYKHGPDHRLPRAEPASSHGSSWVTGAFSVTYDVPSEVLLLTPAFMLKRELYLHQMVLDYLDVYM